MMISLCRRAGVGVIERRQLEEAHTRERYCFTLLSPTSLPETRRSGQRHCRWPPEPLHRRS
jgi:hypothetical protein